MKYRAEIDGLRAVAVLPVIFFHSGLQIFGGGYVGVDIFFVISGYLITTILINDIGKNKFSISHFYERRARRILPALFVVILACLPPAWFLLSKAQMQDFGLSISGATLFASNILFWMEAGYFDTSSELKPLLHTWSLGVEEQYYIIFPVLLLALWKLGKKHAFWVIVMLALMSLALSEWSWRHQPDANFYLLHTRAWEIFAGSICAFIIKKHGVKNNNLLASLGLLAITVSIFIFDKNTPFPSLYALLPVVGVSLLVLFAGKETLVAKLLSLKALVGVGMISYSAYLWHQPILAFLRLYKTDYYLNQVEKIAVLLLTLALAYLTWRFVENPFRHRKLLKTKAPLLFAAAIGSVSMSLIGFFLYINPIVKEANATEKTPSIAFQVDVMEGIEAFKRIEFQQASNLSRAIVVYQSDTQIKCRVLVIGDSHADHLLTFSKVLAEKRSCEVHIISSIGCPPTLGYSKVYDIIQKTPPAAQKACESQIKAWEKFINETGESYDFIILSSRWNWLVGEKDYAHKTLRQDAIRSNNDTSIKNIDRHKNLSAALSNTANIIEASGSKTVILSQPPIQLLDLRDFQSPKAYEKARPYYKDAKERQDLFDNAIRASGVLARSDVTYARVFDILCPSNEEKCINKIDTKSLYNDDDHYSEFGSSKIAEWFIETYSRLFEDK